MAGGASHGGPEDGEGERVSLLTITATRSSTNFSDVSLQDSPPRASGVSISRTSAQNIPTPVRPPPPPVATRSQQGSRNSQGPTPPPVQVLLPAAPVVTRAPAVPGPSLKTAAVSPDESLYAQVAIGYTLPAPAGTLGEDRGAGEGQPKGSWLTSCWRGVTSADPLLVATLLGALVGVLLGVCLRAIGVSRQGVELLGFPGELMLRLLKMLVLPLIAGSMTAGVCSLRSSGGSMANMARYTFLYFAGNMAAAVLLGILLVNLICPGRGQPLAASHAAGGCEAGDRIEELQEGGHTSALTALLGVARSLVPDNVVAAAVNMNILGVITVSLFFGACLSGLGEQGRPLVTAVEAFNAVIARMVAVALWVSPIGVASLISAAICGACAPGATITALGLWMGTVLLGLAIYGGAVLPALLFAVTRRHPLAVTLRLSQALALAFGTSSSAATLPVTMEAVQELGCDESAARFVLPLAATINMTGTALYEATTVIFIAQAHGVELGLMETLVVACTATLAAVGAAAIPSAGLVTMIMVLQAVNLDRFAGDLAVILAVDWLLDRCRTTVNVLGDAFAAIIVDHLCRFRASESGGPAYTQLELT